MLRRSVLPAIAALVLLIHPLTTEAQVRRDTTLTMSDGVKIDAFWLQPAGTPPAGGRPMIVYVHGFNGSKEDMVAEAQVYASQGYAGVAYTVRGQGNSGGTFDFFTSDRVLDDLREVIAWAKSLPAVNQARTAVAGGSQGGIHAWAAAAHDLGVRCVVSVIANGRFDEDWTENSALNWTFARAITVATARLDPALVAMLNSAINTGDNSTIETFLRAHTTQPFERTTSTPTAIFVSYYDGFFNQSATLRQFAAIPAVKRIMTYPGTHTVPPVGPMRNEYARQKDAWFAYWLKDDATQAWVAAPDSAVVMYDGALNTPHTFAIADSACWLHPSAALPKGLTSSTWWFSGTGLDTQAPSAASQKTTAYTNMLGSTAMTFRTAPFAQDAVVAGAQGSVHMRADGTGSQYQMSVYLWDVDPSGTAAAKPITRGHYQVRNNATGDETFDFALNSAMHTVLAGHVIEARVHGGMAFLPNSSVDFGNYVLGPVQNSTNTLQIGGSDPSRFTLYFYDQRAATNVDRPSVLRTAALTGAWPNPFNPSTTISYELPAAAHVRVSVHTLAGTEVAVLDDGVREAGTHTAVWNAGALPSGVYECRMLSGAAASVRALVLVK